jgi:hypothetical protein
VQMSTPRKQQMSQFRTPGGFLMIELLISYPLREPPASRVLRTADGSTQIYIDEKKIDPAPPRPPNYMSVALEMSLARYSASTAAEFIRPDLRPSRGPRGPRPRVRPQRFPNKNTLLRTNRQHGVTNCWWRAAVTACREQHGASSNNCAQRCTPQ